MAAPVVSGTVTLMLEANPRLKPNLIKAILQYTSEVYPGYSPLREGAGFLNSLGAVRLAQFYANTKVGDRVPVQRVWSRQIIWGSHRLTGGYLNPRANAWSATSLWGSARTGLVTGDHADLPGCSDAYARESRTRMIHHTPASSTAPTGRIHHCGAS